MGSVFGAGAGAGASRWRRRRMMRSSASSAATGYRASDSAQKTHVGREPREQAMRARLAQAQRGERLVDRERAHELRVVGADGGACRGIRFGRRGDPNRPEPGRRLADQVRERLRDAGEREAAQELEDRVGRLAGRESPIDGCRAHAVRRGEIARLDLDEAAQPGVERGLERTGGDDREVVLEVHPVDLRWEVRGELRCGAVEVAREHQRDPLRRARRRRRGRAPRLRRSVARAPRRASVRPRGRTSARRRGASRR